MARLSEVAAEEALRRERRDTAYNLRCFKAVVREASAGQASGLHKMIKAREGDCDVLSGNRGVSPEEVAEEQLQACSVVCRIGEEIQSRDRP